MKKSIGISILLIVIGVVFLLDNLNYIHKLTHQKIYAKFWDIKIKKFSIQGFEKMTLKTSNQE